MNDYEKNFYKIKCIFFSANYILLINDMCIVTKGVICKIVFANQITLQTLQCFIRRTKEDTR